MVKGGHVLAGLVGSGSMAAYYSTPDWGMTRMLQRVMDTQGYDRTTAPHSRELEQLYRMVESLSRDVNRQQRAVTIMHGSAGGGPNYVMYVAGVGAVSAVYFKFVCGWRLTDMLYVTRGHLRKGMQEVNEGVSGLQQRLASVRAFFKERIDRLSDKQDQMAAAQDEFGDQLTQVGSDVAKVHDSVNELDGRVENLNLNQMYANDGLYALCRVVSNLIKGMGADRMGGLAELDGFLQARPPQEMPGLEDVLDSDTSAVEGAPGDHARKALAAAGQALGRSPSTQRNWWGNSTGPASERWTSPAGDSPSSTTERQYDAAVLERATTS